MNKIAYLEGYMEKEAASAKWVANKLGVPGGTLRGALKTMKGLPEADILKGLDAMASKVDKHALNAVSPLSAKYPNSATLGNMNKMLSNVANEDRLTKILAMLQKHTK